jgi:hypothetical protein
VQTEQQSVDILAQRRQARADRQVHDAGLLDLHRLAVNALLDPGQGPQIRDRALRQVEKWERGGLCHPRYVLAWRGILGLPAADLAPAMLRDDPEGRALRQNSPLGFLLGQPAP